MHCESPVNKVARTERLTITSTTTTTNTATCEVRGEASSAETGYKAAQFIGTQSGYSQAGYDTLSGPPAFPHKAVSGYGKHYSWTYTPGTHTVSVWDNKGGERVLNFESAPVFPHQGGKVGVSQDEVAFITESSPTCNSTTLAFCSTNGSVKTSDMKTRFQFACVEDGTDSFFKVQSFAVAPPDCPITSNKSLDDREDYVASTSRGILMCVSSPYGTSPNAHDMVPDVVFLNLSVPLPDEASDNNNTSTNQANNSSIIDRSLNSSWLGWFKSPQGNNNNNASYNNNDGGYSQLTSLARQAYQYTNSLTDKTIRNITPVPHTGVLFSVGNAAIALAVKTTHNNPIDSQLEGPSQGMALVWAAPLSDVTHKRLNVVSISCTRSYAYVLATFVDDRTRGGIIIQMSYDTGAVVNQIPVRLPGLYRGDEQQAAYKATLMIEANNMESETAVIVFGNTISRISLGSGVHNPTHSEDVIHISDPILAANCIDGRLFILIPEGPLPGNEAEDLNDTRAKKAIAQLLLAIRTDTRVSADEAVLSRTDAIIQDFPYHSSNWARSRQDSCYAEHAREDQNIFSFINAQVLQRQERHRHFVRNLLGSTEVVSKLSATTIAKVISDQEKLMVLRELRHLQNMNSKTNIQRETQHVLRHCILAVSKQIKESKARIPATFTEKEIASATPGEVFYSHQDNVVSLLEQCNRHLAAVFETPGVDVASKVTCAIATGQIFVRIFEATSNSRDGDLETPTLTPFMDRIWTNGAEDNIAGLIASQVQLLSDALAHAVSISLPMALNTEKVGPNSFRQPTLTRDGDTTNQACDSIPQEVQGVLLNTIDILLGNFMGFASHPNSNIADGLPDQKAEVNLVASTLLRTPFLVANGFSGTRSVYGYPHEAPCANPASSICSDVVKCVESLAVSYSLYDILFAFSLADPTAIDQVLLSARGTYDFDASVRIAARKHYSRYQIYCNTIPSFFVASLHHLARPNDHRVDELRWAPALSGLEDDRGCFQARDLFIREHAPHLVYRICPIQLGERASGDAALGILRGGVDTFDDGLTEVENYNVSCAFAKLALLAYGSSATPVCGQSDRAFSPEAHSPNQNDDYPPLDPPQLLTVNRSCQEAMNEVILHSRISQAQSAFLTKTHPNTILGPQQIVHELAALGDVDALCAAVSICDALANIHSPLETVNKKGPSATVVDLVQMCLTRAVLIDGGSKVLVDIGSSRAVDEQQLFTRTVFQTAQGRVVLSSALLSGDRSAYYAGAIASVMNGTPNARLTPLVSSNDSSPKAINLILEKVYGPAQSEDDRTPQAVLHNWLAGMHLLPPKQSLAAHGSIFGTMDTKQSQYVQSTRSTEIPTETTAILFLDALLPDTMYNAFIHHKATPTAERSTPLQQYLHGISVMVAPHYQSPQQL